MEREIPAAGADHLHPGQIPDGQSCRDYLPYHGGHRCPHHAPAADEDEDGIQKDIHHRSGQRGYHGEAGSAAGPDDGVHGLPEHIEGDAQRDVEEILLRIAEGLGIDGAAEHGQDLIGKQQVQRRQHQTAACRQHHGVAHGSAGILSLALAQRDTDEGAAAVTDHDGDGQRHHSQGKDHRISGISVGTQIAGVGDEDLIHDVVERPHQQGDDAGDGVAMHEPPDGLGLQKLCVVFHRCVLSFGVIKMRKSRKSGLTHFCCTICLWNSAKNVRRFCNRIYAETPHVVRRL